MEKLFTISDKIKKNKINLILIQISEAHTTAWPMAIEEHFPIDKVDPQKSFEDRVKRANEFVEKFDPPYSVFIDSWNNYYDEIYQAWPDKYFLIDKNMKICAMSTYNDREATVDVDCVDVLKNLINK